MTWLLVLVVLILVVGVLQAILVDVEVLRRSARRR
jgi:hypothetical protein